MPWPWRHAIRRDLHEEAAGRQSASPDLWMAWQIVRIAARFRLRLVWRTIGGARPLSGMGGDLALATRMLGRDIWSTLAIAATLALGIGATTATFAAFNHLLFRPVPGVSSERRLVTVMFHPPNSPTELAFGHTAALPAMRKTATALSHLAYTTPTTVAVGAGSREPAFAEAEFVTSQYFGAIGVKPRLGRLLTDHEADTAAQPVVISERLWRSTLDGAVGALGGTVLVNGHGFVLVGVVDDYRGWGFTRGGNTDLWLPIAAEQRVTGNSSQSMYTMVGRMRDGVSIDVVQEQLRAGYENTRQTLARTGGFSGFFPVAYAGLSEFHAEHARDERLRLYRLAMAGVTLLFLLASANAANLLLARACRRERDTAVRLAIGGSRWRIIRQLLFEAVGVSVLAGGMGLVSAIILQRAFAGMTLSSADLADVDIDTYVVGFCLFVSVSSVFVFGLLPAVLASRADVRTVLGRGGRTYSAHHRFRQVLVIAQIAIALMLATGAGVLNRSLRNLFNADFGIDVHNVIELSLRPQVAGRDDAAANLVVDRSIDALRQAGFQIATASPDPMSMNGSRIMAATASSDALDRHSVVENAVSPDYFEILRLPFASGRTFTAAEFEQGRSAHPLPVILNRTLARDIFGVETVAGRTFTLGIANRKPVPAVVTGVVGDTRASAVRPAPRGKIYHAGSSATWRFRTVLIRSVEPAGRAMSRIREVVRGVDPTLPITTLRPLAEHVAESLSEDRVLARLSALVGLMAILLATTGVFAVISQSVFERRRDFGIRSALGASPRQILLFVLRGVSVRAAMGIAAGAALYGLAARWLESRLFEIAPLDPSTIAAAIAGLLIVVLTAACPPAIRAMRIDPVDALRSE